MLLAKRERTSFLFSWQLRGALILSTGFNLAQFWTKPRARWSRKRGNRAKELQIVSAHVPLCGVEPHQADCPLSARRALRMYLHVRANTNRVSSVAAGLRPVRGRARGMLRLASFFKEVPIQNVHPS